jgi:hypothetical protein
VSSMCRCLRTESFNVVACWRMSCKVQAIRSSCWLVSVRSSSRRWMRS